MLWTIQLVGKEYLLFAEFRVSSPEDSWDRHPKCRKSSENRWMDVLLEHTFRRSLFSYLCKLPIKSFLFGQQYL